MNEPASDVNNMENIEPKIIILEPPKEEIKGLKFSKGPKEDDIIIPVAPTSKPVSQQQLAYNSFSQTPQPLQQSSTNTYKNI